MKLGTYRYKYAHGARDMFNALILTPYTMRVEILKESGARYYIRFLSFHADGRGPNTQTYALKKNVTPDDPTPSDYVAPPARLPYKDD